MAKQAFPNYRLSERLDPTAVPTTPVTVVNPTTENPNWVAEAVHSLRMIKRIKMEPDTTITGVRLLDRVTTSANGTTFFHLSYQARELLRAGNGLPWDLSS